MQPDPPTPRRGHRSPAYATRGMVCASQPLAAAAGLDILRCGGSAIDAAIATNACLALMEPTACGIGGDLFAITWDPAAGALAGLNASGRAPASISIDAIEPTAEGTIPLGSTASWSVPGCVDGWFQLHRRFGRLTMAEVLAPAIEYAERGFPLSPVIAREWYWGTRLHRDKPGFATTFMPGGRAPRAGELFLNPGLARALRLIATEGPDAFYEGPIAAAIGDLSRANDGFLAEGDLRDHHSSWDAPISTGYRGYDVWEMPPNSQGLAALQMLNLLELHDLPAIGRDSADHWHLLIEAKKLAYADRARYYTDPAFADVPIAALASKEYARVRAAGLDYGRASLIDSPGDPLALSHVETTYLCVADEAGTIISLIQSNYKGFGSGFTVEEYGFGLQNRGALFALDPGHANCLEPRKRPFQTIIPAFLTRDGAPLMAFGLMGGDMQPQGHAQVIANLIDFGMDPQEAGDAPRLHHGGSSEPTGTVMSGGGVVHLEPGVGPAIRAELARRGHILAATPTSTYGGYQAIWRDPLSGIYCGATESRKDGVAIGY